MSHRSKLSDWVETGIAFAVTLGILVVAVVLFKKRGKK